MLISPPILRLPMPDRFGNFWLVPQTSKMASAVFPCKQIVGDEVKKTGKYMAYVNPEYGFVVEDGKLKLFDRALDALEAIRCSTCN